MIRNKLTYTLLLLALLGILLAVPAAAYSIYLKDGSRIVAEKIYRLEEGKAIITLQNGTETFIEVDEIDVDRTRDANRSDHGSALYLDDGDFTDEPVKVEVPQKERLTDFGNMKDSAVHDRPQARRPTLSTQDAGETERTLAGYQDLSTRPRQPFSDLEIATEIRKIFGAQGIEELQIFEGSGPTSPFLEITANSEASVFRSLEAAADSLLHLRERYAGQVETLEILMSDVDRDGAGQFFMDLSEATQLAQGEIEVSTYFVEKVQF